MGRISRRHFLGGLSLASGAALIGPSLLVSTAKAAAKTLQNGEFLNASHWGAFRAKVVDGVWQSTKAIKEDHYPTKMLEGLRGLVYSPARARYPMVRLDFLKNKEKSDKSQRGDNRFVRVSWDEALDLVFAEMERVQDTYGPSALYGGHSGWRSVGKLHSANTLLYRMLNLYGPYVKKVGDMSTGAAQVILPRVAGSMEVYEQMTSYPHILDNSKNIILWGCDPIKNNQIAWNVPDHEEYIYWQQIKDKVNAGEIKLLSIDPVVNDTQEFIGDKAVQWNIRPQTDVPLMLALAHTMIKEDIHDKEFIDTYTVGLDQFIPYLMGETEDNVEKTAEWAAEICGIDAEEIKNLARDICANRTQFMAGWCLQRMHHGEQWAWMIVVLSALTGQIGLPGGGFGFSFHYNGAGNIFSKGPALGGISGSVEGAEAFRKGDFGDASDYFPVASFIDAMLNPGKEINFNGKKLTYPHLQMAIFAGNNPLSHQTDINKAVKGFQQLETIVAIDSQWTATARFADIVLPATTTMERNDIERFGPQNRRGIVAMHQVVKPQFEARNDFDIMADLCDRFGKREEYTQGMDEMQWLQSFYDTAKEIGAKSGVEMPDFEAFWQQGIVEHPKGEAWVRHAEFREDPDFNPLGTPSGLIEIYSKTIDKFGYDDCKGHPTWMEPYERSGQKDAKYAFHLESSHPPFRLHSQLCGADEWRKSYAVGGKEPAFMNPQDAEAKGIKDGDIVRVFNDRGQILAGAKLDDRFSSGIIRICEGAWYNPVEGGKAGTLCAYGLPNVLTADIGSSQLAQAISAHSTIVDVEKYEGPAHEPSGFNGAIEESL